MKKNKQNKECGAVIIEATIALTTFMFAIVSVLFVAHICYAQAKIGTVIDGVAKDLSEFSYVYSLTGFAKKQSRLNADGAQAQQSIDNVVDNLDNVNITHRNVIENVNRTYDRYNNIFTSRTIYEVYPQSEKHKHKITKKLLDQLIECLRLIYHAKEKV